MEELKCHSCRKLFKRKRSQVLLARKHYCSVACHNLAKKKGKIISCFVCGRMVYKKSKDLVNSKNKKYFCSTKCSSHWLGEKSRGKKHPNWISGVSTYKNLLKRTNVPMICGLCDEKDTRILIVHHVDKNRENNELFNLVWLCHNCHFLVHRYVDESNNLNNKLMSYANPSM